MKKYSWLIVIALSILISCKKKTESIDMKTDYFPLKVGSWIIYDVDSTYYDDFTLTSHTHHFQLKEMIASSFIDGQGDAAYRLERYERDGDTSAFVLKNVWTEKLVNNRAEKVEENQRFVKLVFPPQISLTWKGNAYLQINLTDITTKFLGNWDYAYNSIDVQKSFGNNTFNQTATVVDDDETVPFLQKTNFVETYARGVGLVYYHHQYVEKQPNNVTWVAGFDVTATINSYGNN